MSELPAPPYPADTRAKGWRFELDYELIDQSETWPIAAEIPMAQHALLMMWFVAWSKQVPCGSFPKDENSIRAACRIPPSVWSKSRDVLMRGWWLADDGRMYHDTIVKRVIEMMSKRRSDSDRQAAKRAREALESARLASESARSHDDVTRDKHVTPVGVGSESRTDHRPPTTLEEREEKAPRKRAADPDLPKPDDVAEQVWLDWVKLRKGKRAAVSATVLTEARREAAKAGLTLERFFAVWCARGSQGLEAEWLKPNERGSAPLSFRERDEQNAIARVHEMTGGLASAKPPTRRDDALQEVFDAAPRLVG